jgi:hypothetical protein
MKRRTFLAACVVFSSGALSARPNRPAQAPQPTADQSSEVSSSPNDSAIAHVHIYRQHRYTGSALSPSVFVDGKQIARVGSGRRVTIKLAVGTHTLTSDDKSSRISLDTKPGSNYYIRIDEETGFWKGHGRLTLVEPDQGRPEYQLEKPIEQDRIVDKTMIEEDHGETTPGNG